MRKKLRLPILLLAVVIMLSIFYVKEAQNTQNTQPVDGDNFEVSTLNPEFTEERLLSLTAMNSEIEELEKAIASGALTSSEVKEATAKITTLKEIKYQEAELEAEIMLSLQYNDVLVVYKDNTVYVDVFTDTDLSVATYINIARLAKTKFGVDCMVTLDSTNSLE